MDNKRQCPTCGRQFDEQYQFCPFDATALTRKCPSCGKSWDGTFQFCPLDSTPLTTPVAAPTPPTLSLPHVEPRVQVAPPPPPLPPVTVAAAPAPTQPSPARPAPVPTPAAFTFTEQVAPPGWKATVFRPMNILFAIGVVAVAFAVWYLNLRTSGPDLPPPMVSYSLLVNEGKTKGVPIAIKLNQLTLFMIDDPMDTGDAARAKQIVATLDETIKPLKIGSEVRFAVEQVGGRPALLEVTESGPQPKTLATVTEGDVTLAGETDAMRLASQWAERLTDAVKIFVFGEAPKFSTGTEFGDSLLAMYKAATGAQGKVSKKSLDLAFQRLPAAQRRALETPPLARRR